MKPTSVFKWLFITFILITIPFIGIEYVNIATSAPLLKNHIRKSLQAACDYYSAETYLDANDSRYNLPNLHNSANGAFIGGDFYGNLSQNTIYNQIITSFKADLVNTTVPYYSGSATSPERQVYAKDYLPNLEDYAEGRSSNFFQGQVTPANLGITHINEDVTLKIFQYNLASTLIGGNTENMKVVDGKNVVKFNGFEVDIDDVRIAVQHTVTPVGSKYYEVATGLDSSKLDGTGGIGGSSNDNVIVAEVSYVIPVRYKGITPMNRAVEWIWSNEMRVKGTKDNAPTYQEVQMNMEEFGEIQSGQSNLNLIDKIYYTIVD